MRYRAGRRTGIRNNIFIAIVGAGIIFAIIWKKVEPILQAYKEEAPDFGRVAHIYDGDTFKLANGMTVRLLGVEAPARGEAAQKARDALATLIWEKNLNLKYGADPYDDFGRLAAWVWVDGKLVQQELVDRKLVISNSSNLSNLGGGGVN